MKVSVIRNEEDCSRKDLAYLIYYENDKRFYIELPEEADEWETPLILSTFLRKGEKTVNAYWSREWVRQRIIPPDRQNLGQILKENGLEEYDEYELLMLGHGRCSQDNYYIATVNETIIEERFKERYEKKIEDVIPLKKNNLLVFFRNGEIKKCEITTIVNNIRSFSPILASETVFNNVNVQAGGYGVHWGENAEISDIELYKNGKTVDLSMDDFISFVSNRVISSTEAGELLHCSRQYINELVKNGKLNPVKAGQKTTLFLKSEVQQRKWK